MVGIYDVVDRRLISQGAFPLGSHKVVFPLNSHKGRLEMTSKSIIIQLCSADA